MIGGEEHAKSRYDNYDPRQDIRLSIFFFYPKNLPIGSL